MRKTLIAAIAALTSMGVSAHAADIYGGSYKDAPVVYAPAPIWAGLYVGGSVGFGVGDTSGSIEFDRRRFEGDDDDVAVLREIAVERRDERIDFIDFLEALLQSENDVNGAIYGAHIGYNFQRNSNLVYGVELGINGTGMDGSGTCAVLGYCSRSMDWYATAVGRLGYASGRTLFYGFGGVAWGDVKTEIGIASPGLTIFEGEETHVGWTAGVGIEHALTDRFIVGIEYSHVDLGEEDTTLSIEGRAIPGITDKVDLEFDAIKVRGSYMLSGGREPLETYK